MGPGTLVRLMKVIFCRLAHHIHIREGRCHISHTIPLRLELRARSALAWARRQLEDRPAHSIVPLS
jgi:hypothetical protein